MTWLVTGGTGSFGRALIGRFHDTQHIRVYSRDEEKQRRLSLEFPHVECVIGDVRDAMRFRQAARGTDLIIHAAALKQIPACESNPGEALRTNVLGSELAAVIAAELGIPLVALSTDKAVEPANFYGATKLLAERLVLAYGGSVVRYGNVLGSRGSVVPVFRQQIANGQPLTITDERMTRFILTLDQAIALVELAITEAKAAVYVAKPPAVDILSLALAIGGLDYPTVVTGIRPGEKLHECLVSPAEHAVEHEDFFEVHPELPAIGWAYTSDIARRIAPDALSGLLAHVPLNDL